MGPLYVTFVCVALASLVAGVPVGIPFPRPSGDDPYAHRPHNEIAPDHVAPTLTPTATPKPTPRVGSTLHAVKFMQKFGYIPQGDEEADFLFSPGTLEASIKRMQKFGSIPQTGVIDNATIELMQTPRCGVPDVDADEIVKFRRPKRYIVGSEGWKKRELTYFLANWTPQLYSKENVQKELRRAFDAWSTYSHLDFKEVEAPDADIVIFFATYNHHDGYSFDGPSGILAHAYFPYEFGHYGGDVHFDESEKWTIKPKDEYAGLDFFTVAVHEIGHSLGLAHSPVADSIMFPYYKGYTPHFSLAYDDVMAMWELYIKRKLEGDDEYFNRTTTTTTTTPSPPTTDEDHQSDAANDGDDGEGDDVHRRDDERKRTDEEDFYEEDRKRREEEERRREEDRKRRREDEEEKRRWEEEVRRRGIGEGNKYAAYVAEVAPQGGVFSLNIDCSRQIFLEFLHTEENEKPLGDSWIAKLLVFVHRESIAIYSFPLSLKDGASWIVDDQPLTESVVRSFVWAQWEPRHNHLYYLHYRPPPEVGLTLGSCESEEDEMRPRPMLTALQFHPNKPHETVLNVPLELSGLEHSPMDLSGDYRDQGLLHTAGDAWLDLRVVTSPSGAVCICHHYIYKSRLAETPADPESCAVYLAYSVTLLHHGCVLHTVVPGVPWGHAHSALPTYSLFGDHYLLVIVPGVCMHMLDIGLDHMPTNHIVTTPPPQLLPNAQLFQICGKKVTSGRSMTFVDGVNQMLVEVRVTKESLFSLFKCSAVLSNRLAILHLASVHDKDHDLSRKLMWSVCEDPYNLDTPVLLQEYLVGETYAAVHKHIDSDAGHLISLLPITTAPFTTDTEYIESPAEENVRISYCLLENACIMLLSPRERVVRSISDTWTKLWEHTSCRHHQRFSLTDVVDKLMVSLDTYKPEALSQGSTPVSPASPLVGGLTITSLGLTLAHLMFDPLPFNEAENTTSSKLEHLLSVNLRELSMYCLKHFPHESPMRVHAVASKYVCTQLQVSRRLCSILCSSQTLVPTEKSEKGFTFIEQLEDAVATRLFTLLERYHSATEAVAFPLPQGYNSFLAYLAHRCLPHLVFMQYVQRGVLQLNVDVLREIVYDLDDTPQNVERKLEIISSVPLVRSLRALQYWQHPMSLILRSRLHAGSILAGEGPGQPRTPTQSARINAQHIQNKGLTAFPTADRLSPFDTFLDLLTAKANLTDLDLGLLYEGTIASLEYIKPEMENELGTVRN